MEIKNNKKFSKPNEEINLQGNQFVKLECFEIRKLSPYPLQSALDFKGRGT